MWPCVQILGKVWGWGAYNQNERLWSTVGSQELTLQAGRERALVEMALVHSEDRGQV